MTVEHVIGGGGLGGDPSKKRTSDDAGLKLRGGGGSSQRRPVMAPRVARMVKRGIKETTAVQKKATGVVGGVVGTGGGPNKANSKISDLPIPENDTATMNDSKAGPNVTQELRALKDPYDPAEPNDYQEYCKERLRKQQEKERMVELQLQLKERQQELSKPRVGAPGGPSGVPGANFNGVPGMSPVAERLMKKMGWKGRGHGLGRQEQGMIAPLIAQKSGAGAQGIIIHAESKRQQSNPTEITPSTVVVLRNMADPGDVDDMLCGETARECMKYGTVLACEVWEVPVALNVAPEDAVRLFVKFEKYEQAHQALIDLDGRFFAGRNVKADYYPKDKFERGEYDGPLSD